MEALTTGPPKEWTLTMATRTTDDPTWITAADPYRI